MGKQRNPYADRGRLVPGHSCPKCGAPILYNGNYFCAYWSNTPHDDGGCDWVNPAVFLGEFTMAEAAFADALIEALTGKPHDSGLAKFAIDNPNRVPYQ